MRRFVLCGEPDTLRSHGYCLACDGVEYILETLPIVKRKDEAAYGEHPSNRVILEMFDQTAPYLA